jgi:choline dehydrogenase-like flavoprotein
MVLGGNAKIWGGVLGRMREREFGAVRLQKGSTPAWELSYNDFAPYYDRAERLYRVHGKAGVDPTEPSRQADYDLAPGPSSR